MIQLWAFTRCTCPAETLGRFWRVRYPRQPRVTVHVVCGRVREWA